MDRRSWDVAKIQQSEMLAEAQRRHLAALANAEIQTTPTRNRWRVRMALAAATLLLAMMISLLYFSTVPGLVAVSH